MTLRVYRLDVATGEQTELPTVDPGPVLSAGLTQTYPPCTCARCQPRTGPVESDAQLPIRQGATAADA